MPNPHLWIRNAAQLSDTLRVTGVENVSTGDLRQLRYEQLAYLCFSLFSEHNILQVEDV